MELPPPPDLKEEKRKEGGQVTVTLGVGRRAGAARGVRGPGSTPALPLFSETLYKLSHISESHVFNCEMGTVLVFT